MSDGTGYLCPRCHTGNLFPTTTNLHFHEKLAHGILRTGDKIWHCDLDDCPLWSRTWLCPKSFRHHLSSVHDQAYESWSMQRIDLMAGLHIATARKSTGSRRDSIHQLKPGETVWKCHLKGCSRSSVIWSYQDGLDTHLLLAHKHRLGSYSVAAMIELYDPILPVYNSLVSYMMPTNSSNATKTFSKNIVQYNFYSSVPDISTTYPKIPSVTIIPTTPEYTPSRFRSQGHNLSDTMLSGGPVQYTNSDPYASYEQYKTETAHRSAHDNWQFPSQTYAYQETAVGLIQENDSYFS